MMMNPMGSQIRKKNRLQQTQEKLFSVKIFVVCVPIVLITDVFFQKTNQLCSVICLFHPSNFPGPR